MPDEPVRIEGVRVMLRDAELDDLEPLAQG